VILDASALVYSAPMSFFDRLKLALSILFGGALPPQPALPPPLAPPQPAPELTPEQRHAGGLFVLGVLQREGRLLDFLKEDIAGFSDADVGAAARLVHEGCRKALFSAIPIEAVVAQAEGASVTVPQGFDANRWRLVGNVTGAGPWTGTLKHHGWVAVSITLPPVPTTVDVKVLAPAEVELA
jgi:hypothetical protein